MNTITPQNDYHDHRDISPMLAWLSGAFADLEYQGQCAVDHYWTRLREGRVGRYKNDLGTVGLRLRRRSNGAFSLEWYLMTYLGKTKRPIAGEYIRKGRSHKYNLDPLLKHQPEWLKIIVRDVEEILCEIRRRQAMLIKLRNPLATYVRELEGKKVYGSSVVQNYRATSNGGSNV